MSPAQTIAMSRLSERSKRRLIQTLIKRYGLQAKLYSTPPQTRRTARRYAAKLEAFVIAQEIGNALRGGIATRAPVCDGDNA